MPTKDNPIVFISAPMKMVNKQLMGANATAEVAEAINTPGVNNEGNRGMYVEAIVCGGSPVLQTFYPNPATTAAMFTCQVQYGNQAATPVCVDPDSPYYFASTTLTSTISTNGGVVGIPFPFDVRIATPEPVIVTDYFTVVLQGCNDPAHNDELLFTEIWFRECLLDDGVYNRLTRNQHRLS